MGKAAQSADDRNHTPFAEYANAPVAFMRDVLGSNCWGELQEAVANDLATHDRVSVRSGHGIGKTWLAARLALWFNQTRPHSKVITTAPKWEQVEQLIWQEIRDAWARSTTPLLGTCLTTHIDVAPNWFATGMNAIDPIKFQGVHAAGGVLLVVDEASGLPEKIFQAARGFMTQGGSKMFLIGNPNLRYGQFFRSFGAARWHNHKIPSTASPMVSAEWVQEMRDDCGPTPERHPMYQVRVMAEFPDTDESGLFPLSALEASQYAHPAPSGRHMGVDVARYGGDSSVALLLVDGRVAAVYRWDKASTMRTAAMVYALARKWRVPTDSANVHVDVAGVGGGVVDRLEELNVRVDPVDFGSAARGDWSQYNGTKVRFLNLRAELYWSARRLLDEGQLVIPDRYQRLWTDLQGIPYTYGKGDKLEIAPKRKIRELLGRSPDDADALVVALSRPNSMPVRVVTLARNSRRRKARQVDHGEEDDDDPQP